MRTIKFRAWNPIESKLEYWTLNDLCYHTPDRPDICLQDWQQFTGLLDKNGVEIYEGDIVIRNIYTVVSGRTEMSKPYEIVWDSKKAGFEYKTDGYKSGLFHEIHEVIGNIYQNPEFLTQASSQDLDISKK